MFSEWFRDLFTGLLHIYNHICNNGTYSSKRRFRRS